MKYQHVWAGENRSEFMVYFDDLEELKAGIPSDILRAAEIAVAGEDVKRVSYCVKIEIEKWGK